MNPLILAARHGPWILVGGLAAGLLLPGLAEVLSPLIPQMVAGLLFLGVLRMDPPEIVAALTDLPKAAGFVLVLQLALPLSLLTLAWLFDLLQSPVILALVLMTSAPSIVGSPNFCAMLGLPSAFAMSMLVVGTMLFPLTIIPVFWILPTMAGLGSILIAAGKLFLLITAMTLIGLGVRRFLLPRPSAHLLKNLDGAAAIFLAVFVIGLMPALSAVLTRSPMVALGWLALACGANFGLQLLFRGVIGHRLPVAVSTPVALIAGNRNIALFLVALPETVTAPIMIFIGCYQIPMYLTPLLLARLNRRGIPSDPGRQ